MVVPDLRGLWRLAAPVAALFAGTACDATPPPPPNVLIVLVDALRADHLSTYGYARETAPHLDALAAESMLYRNAHAQSSWTKPSIPTLFTSLYPIQHGVYEGQARGRGGALESDVLSEDSLTVAEVFRDHGYATAAFVNNAHLEAGLGFSQGFSVYEQESFDAPDLNDRFFTFLDAPRERPFFVYLHYLDVHWPFQPSGPYRELFPGLREDSVFESPSWRGLRDSINRGRLTLSDDDVAELVSRHDAAIAEFDHHLGAMIEGLRERGLLDQTVLLLTSDHGEELLDHGRVGHGGTLYREVTEIPMLLRLPDAARAGEVETVARLLDLFPTLVSAAGIGPVDGLEGRDLLAASGDPPELVAETLHKRKYRISVQRDGWKLIRTYRAERERNRALPGHFGLTAGLRVMARGTVGAEGELHARKLSVRESTDDDIELIGPIAEIREDDGSFSIRGVNVDAHDLFNPAGDSILAELRVGQWVKVEGFPRPGGAVEADKLERLGEDVRDDEVEGIVERLETLEGEATRVWIGGIPAVVTEETRLRNIPLALTRSAPGGWDRNPFSPARLLSSAAPPFEDQLFDLASDREEREDLAQAEPERLALLADELSAWLRRMSEHRGWRASDQPLEESTIERLRTLGYLE
jgi:arylsulfatase A-like enzyme